MLPSGETAHVRRQASTVSDAHSFPLSNSHTRSVLSSDAEIARPSAVTATARTALLWPSSVQRHWPVPKSQTRSVQSRDAETARRPSAYGNDPGHRYHYRGGTSHPSGEVFLPVGTACNPSALVSTHRARPCRPASIPGSSANTSLVTLDFGLGPKKLYTMEDGGKRRVLQVALS
jgi:hypothetical protein